MSPTIPPSKKKHIIIIGGGIIGATTAYYLTRHPFFDSAHHTITLLEANAIASGASGKAGGLLALWAYPRELVRLSWRLHAGLAVEHGGEERWGYRRVGVGSLSLEGKGREGRVKVKGDLEGLSDKTADGKGSVSLQKRSGEATARMRKAGLPGDLDWFEEECVRGYESMGTTEDTAQVHPYLFTRGMVELAVERGVRVLFGRCEEVVFHQGKDGGVKGVRYTEKESGEMKMLEATDVVVTAGPWSGRVWPAAPVGSLRAHSVTIRPTREVSAYAVFTRIALPMEEDGGRKKRGGKVNYVSPEIYARPNNEVYACGEGDQLVPLPRGSEDVEVDQQRCEDIVQAVGSVSDVLREGELLVRQACYLPVVERGAEGPLVGLTGTKGVYLAAGHTCWGIMNGPATGLLMSEFVFEGRARSADVDALDPRMVM
jgi:glycine/D-amino acid oxidase-like deaminating enzyme